MTLTNIGPDCRDNKHPACDARAMDLETDEVTDCDCSCHAPAEVECSSCGQPRPADETAYNPMQAITGGPLGWYSGDDGEICSDCMTNIIRGSNR
ncbi:hypothetical protein AB0K08_13675 [Citricoccus sp. NPDC055426]|uniref:hypothetical protein n=1 Tax=Citricoccus sp. NPDC055426 TaxID=3155536 RepID=UPI00343B6E06